MKESNDEHSFGEKAAVALRRVAGWLDEDDGEGRLGPNIYISRSAGAAPINGEQATFEAEVDGLVDGVHWFLGDISRFEPPTAPENGRWPVVEIPTDTYTRVVDTDVGTGPSSATFEIDVGFDDEIERGVPPIKSLELIAVAWYDYSIVSADRTTVSVTPVPVGP